MLPEAPAHPSHQGADGARGSRTTKGLCYRNGSPEHRRDGSPEHRRDGSIIVETCLAERPANALQTTPEVVRVHPRLSPPPCLGAASLVVPLPVGWGEMPGSIVLSDAENVFESRVHALISRCLCILSLDTDDARALL